MKSTEFFIQLKNPFAQIIFVTKLTTSQNLSEKFKKKNLSASNGLCLPENWSFFLLSSIIEETTCLIPQMAQDSSVGNVWTTNSGGPQVQIPEAQFFLSVDCCLKICLTVNIEAT